MKRTCLVFLFAIICFPCFSQIINEDYFPKDNKIDKQYTIELSKLDGNINNWKAVVIKYNTIWEQQMYLEMERLISIIPESENKIRETQKKWDEVLDESYFLAIDNINIFYSGMDAYIGEFLNDEKNRYRERAKYYLCLYYTIKDQQSKDLCHTDKTELAN